MDISFSNVLEGARQYFQGLPSPAANSSQSAQPATAPAPVPPAVGDPQPQQQPPSNHPARFDNVPTSAPPTTSGAPQQSATTTPGSPSVLSYWPPISSASTYQRKEVAATTMPPSHVAASPAPTHHVKTPNTVFNGSRPNPSDNNQSNYPAPQRPQGHNLPPIAALSNYHSSRSSRDSLTTPRIQPQTSHSSSKGFHRTQQSEYTLPRQNQAQFVSGTSASTARPQYGHQGPKYQQLGVVPSSLPTPTVSASYHGFPTTPASVSMSSTSSSSTSSSTNPVSSHPQQPQFAYHPLPEQPSKPLSRQPQYPTQQLPYFNVSPAPSQQSAMVNGHQKPPPAPTPAAARPRTKRESPLDLSVKTVRQSADSTAADDSEGFAGGRNYSPAPAAGPKNRAPLPPLQLPSSVAYPTMDSRGTSRTPVTPNNSISKSIGAPKIDFLANFAAHQHSSTPTTYGPESLHRPSDRTQNQQPYPQQHSSTALPHVGSFKSIPPSGSFNHKPPQSVPFNHPPAQASTYDAKQTPPVAAYNHKLAQSAAAFNHKQAQSALYDSKYGQFAAYNHKSTHPTPYNQKQTPPTTYEHNKQTQQAPYEHIKQVSPATYEHKPATTYDHSKGSQPASYDNSKQTQPTPYDPGKQTQSAAYEHNKHPPASFDQSKQVQLASYDQGKQPQPASYNHSKQMHLAAYDHNKQSQLASYDQTKQVQTVSFNHSKSAVPYDNKQTQPTPFDHKQTHPTPFDHKQTQPTPFDHKQTQPTPFDHKQAAPASYDFKKLQSATFDAKQTLQQPTYDHNKQPQTSHFNVKHVQSGSFDYKVTQAPSFDHNSQPHPPTYEYKQTYDHKQSQYYPTATQPQHRQPSKPSPAVQSYPNNSHYTPPVPAGYDPAKRVVEGAPGFGGGRVDYRQVPNSAAYPNQGLHKRMMGEARHASPAKVPRLDTWRQTIDQQIEQRLSSYASSRQQQQQPVNNGNSESNGSTTAQDAQYAQRSQNTSRVNPPQHSFNTTSAGPTPPFPNRGPNLQKLLSSVTTPKPGRISMPGGGAADKRVLNILRNTLEEKEARMTLLQNQLHHNAQLQQQYQQRQPHPPEAPVQLMPLQKPSLSPTLPPGRLNLPPFGTVVENAHTSQHKLHLPRAVDSVRLDQDSSSQKMTEITRNTGIQQGPPSQELDGFAAYLAARIRTKAELKQVGPGMEHLMHHQSFRCPTPSSSVISVSNSSVQSARTTPGTPTVFSPPPPMSSTEDKLGDISRTTTTPSTQANAGGGGASSSSGSPPKLTRERGAVVPPRRRLFSRPDEEQGGVGSIPGGPVLGPVGPFLPPRDLSGLRSSSETSVFDFRDSDSEGEMPVLERQTLNEMRKDRRCHPKQPAQVLTTVEEPSEPVDPFWSDTCDKFLEELRTGTSAEGTKRGRGRRKKIDTEGKCIKSEKDIKSEVNEKSENNEPFVISEAEVKKENIEANTVIIKKEKIKVEGSSNELKKRKVLDSKDVPLRKRRARLKSEEDDVDDEISLAEIKARLGKRQDSASDRIISESELSDDDESEEKIETVAERLRRRKRQQDEEDSKVGMRLRSKDPSSPRKTSDTPTKSSLKKKKPHFGDGSDFTPGWEEQVYRFKRSLRMPARLINISRPPDASRLCASLPDLDPCPNSPAASTMDSSDFQAKRSMVSSNLLRRWDAESDLESNSNLSMPCESEEATSSSIISNKQKDKKCQIKEKNNSLLNLLVQKYGRAKSPRKKVGENKWLERPGARILPRKTAPELLPTPSLGIGSPKRGPYKKGKSSLKKKSSDDLKKDPFSEIKDSVYLGYFRRKTVTNFRDAFLQNGSSLGSAFAPIVFKSRTRTQTRVMRQRATIREVFGEDRPASCPPTCREENLAVEEDGGRRNSNTSQGRGNQTMGRSAAMLRSNKAVLNSKRHLLQGGRRRNLNLIRALASKTLQELSEDVDPKDKNYKLVDLLPQISTIKAIAEGVVSENEVRKAPLVKRIKLRTGRRKFRSGFDYIRKKKKYQKKEDGDVPKVKKKAAISRPSSESVQDIQNEIRGWVINKGLGETLLHRAARLGYTDVAAYCLETLDNPASPRDNAGYTPLHEACSRGHLDIARLLLMYGANVSDSAQGGIRPLHEAAESGCMEMMRLLLSYGADPLLATYGGQTPLSLATDEAARRLLQLHLADVQGLPAQPWNFQGPASCCDPKVRGYDVLQDPPCLSPEPLEDDEIEMELSEMALPVVYRLSGEPPTDRWVLLQDLTTILRVKSKDALLRQLGPEPRSILKELKMADFLEQARCCHLLGSGEKINIRASKVALVPYNEKVREILGVEKVTVSSR